MDTTESLGYLKGLIEGLDLGDNKKETKVFSAIVDVLSNLVEDIDDMREYLVWEAQGMRPNYRIEDCPE